MLSRLFCTVREGSVKSGREWLVSKADHYVAEGRGEGRKGRAERPKGCHLVRWGTSRETQCWVMWTFSVDVHTHCQWK